MHPPFADVDIVFLAGGTCRIPYVKRWVKEIFPNAEIVIDGELEIITATGATIHALQVLSGEVEPYIRNIKEENDDSNHNSRELDEKLLEGNSASNDDLYSDKNNMMKKAELGTRSDNRSLDKKVEFGTGKTVNDRDQNVTVSVLETQNLKINQDHYKGIPAPPKE